MGSRHIFGPGLYLTEDHQVASAYVFKHQGAFYELDLTGPAGGVLDLRLDLAACRSIPRYVLQLVPPSRIPGQTLYDQLADLHGPDYDDTRYGRLNRQLLAYGIWLIAGYAGGSTAQGLMDRGVQYVLLDFDRVQHVRGPL